MPSPLHSLMRPASLLPAFAALIVGALAMGVSPIFVRLADTGPFASAFWRVALAIPFLFLWMRLEKDRLPLRVLLTKPAVWWAGLLFAGDLTFWHLAIHNTSVANATFLSTMAPISVVLGSFLLIGERVERKVLFGLALCLVGGAVLLGGSYTLAPERLVGDFYGLVTSIFFGLYFLAVRVARRAAPPGAIIFATSVITALLLFVEASLAEATLQPQSLNGFFVLIGLALISHTGGQGLLAYALGHVPAAFSSLVIFLEALAAAAVGWLILGEAVGWEQALGGLLILAGIYGARPRE